MISSTGVCKGTENLQTCQSGMIQKFRFQMISYKQRLAEVWCETTIVAKTVELPYIYI